MSYYLPIATIPTKNRLTSLSTTQTQRFLSTIEIWADPLSLATTQGIFPVTRGSFSFPPVTEMFHFAELPLCDYVFITKYPYRNTRLLQGGFPHSGTSGLKRLFASYPKLFAGYHALHRLHLPRHSLYALKCFISLIGLHI